MLERVQRPGGVVIYESPRLRALGVVHCFSTRHGGISKPPFNTMNLGNPSGCAVPDLKPNMLENYRLLQAALGYEAAPRAWVHQVHGNQVAVVGGEGDSEYGESLAAEMEDQFSGQLHADALFTRSPGVFLTVRVADCVPVLFASPPDAGTGKPMYVAAAHAGWRGVVQAVVQHAVQAFLNHGIKAREVVAAIGPHIGVSDFAVGAEVAAQFESAGLAAAVKRAYPKPHVDLRQAILTQLNNLGVEQVDVTDASTAANRDDFFSHRRDHGLTGRHAAMILQPPASSRD